MEGAGAESGNVDDLDAVFATKKKKKDKKKGASIWSFGWAGGMWLVRLGGASPLDPVARPERAHPIRSCGPCTRTEKAEAAEEGAGGDGEEEDALDSMFAAKKKKKKDKTGA